MKPRAFLYLLASALVLSGAVTAGADVPLVDRVNAVPSVCVPVRSALFAHPEYVTPSPANQRATLENAGYLFIGTGGFTTVPWKRLLWNQFRDDNPDKYNALIGNGQYDQNYVVYEAYLDFYGEGQIHPVYSLVHMRSESLPEIFVQDGSALAEGLKKLGASDLLEYGPRAYPVVRSPGHISVYEIDTDQPGKQTFEQKKYIPNLICDFAPDAGPRATAPVVQAQPQPATEVAPALAQQPVAAAPSAAAATPASPAAFDPCAAFQTANPAYYAACEDRQQKMQSLSKAAGQN